MRAGMAMGEEGEGRGAKRGRMRLGIGVVKMGAARLEEQDLRIWEEGEVR